MVETAAQAIGIAQLKEEQKQAVCSFVSGNDVFVSLPTGYGKCPATASEGSDTGRFSVRDFQISLFCL